MRVSPLETVAELGGGFTEQYNVQHINGTSFVLSAPLLALFAFPPPTASKSFGIRRQSYIARERAHSTASGLSLFLLSPPRRSCTSTWGFATPSSSAPLKAPDPTTTALRGARSLDITGEGDIVDVVLVQGVRITFTRRLRWQKLVEARPSIHIAVAAALSLKECKRAAGVTKVAKKVLVNLKQESISRARSHGSYPLQY